MKNCRISNIPEMDRLRGRQILTYLLLRSEEQQFRHDWRPHSVPDSQSEHWRIHGFGIGKIHGSNQRIVFLLVHGRGLDYPPNTQWAQLGVALMLNGNQVGLGHVEGHANWKWQHTPLVIQATLDMKKGDQVWLQIKLISPSVVLVDSFNQHNHYTGMLLHEDIFPNL